MKRVAFLAAAALGGAAAPAALLAQQPTQPPASPPYVVGNPLGLPVTPGAAGTFEPVS